MPALGRLRGKPSAPQEEVNADQQRGEVEVVVISASNLAAKDSNGSSDPYVRITCIEPTRSRKKTTTQKRMNLNPTWNERFFFADVAGNGRIVFDVFDADENGSDDLIGKVTIPLERLARNELSEANYEMIDGDIRLAVAFRPGKTGSTKGDVIDASLTPALLPGGPDGPQVVGRPFSDVQHDSDELLSEIRAIAEQLQRSAGRLFEDEDFAGPRSLFIEPKRVPDDFLDGGRKEVVMMRPREINPKMMLFYSEPGDVREIEPDDINQGEIGDCYLLAALSAIASQERLVKDLIVEDFGHLGLYGVKLCDWTGWRTIVVDDRLPCDARSRRQVFAHSDSGSEFWAAIFEKAWAKLHGNYEVIEGGDTADTLAYLTGGRCEQIAFKERPDPAAFWEELLAHFRVNEGDDEDCCFLSAGGAIGSRGGKEDPESVPKDDRGGLVSGHAYSVLELREALGHRLIKLRNPWGSFEWDGDWSDDSALWTPQAVAAFGFRKSADGEFWMSWADFLANFTRVGVVTTVPRAAPVVNVTGSWRAGLTAAGEDKWLTYNPRYLLQTSKRTTAHIMLTQPDTRALGGGGFLEMVVRVFLIGKSADVHAPLEAEQQLTGAMATVWGRKGTLSVEIDPAKGQHVVVVSLWAPGWEGEYGLSVALESRDVRLSLQELAPLRPPAEAAAEMRAKPVSNKCATCREPCALGRGSRYFKCVRWHDRPSCYQCANCHAPFETERSKLSYTHAAPGHGSAPPRGEPRSIHDVHEDRGRLGGYCKPCARDMFSPRCLHCNEPVDEGAYYTVSEPAQGRVHSHCYEQFRTSNAAKCVVCAKPVLGSYYPQPEGKVHTDCFDAYTAMTADKCIVCAKPLTGQFYDLPEGKVHAEGDCYDVHMEAKAPKCVACGKAVTGSFYELPEGACHAEGDCYDQHQARRR